jgi:hypothetical protein
MDSSGAPSASPGEAYLWEIHFGVFFPFLLRFFVGYRPILDSKERSLRAKGTTGPAEFWGWLKKA